MKPKRYCITESGREPFGEYTKREALVVLKDIIADRLRLCKARYGHGYKHKDGDHGAIITLGPDRNSALWARINLMEL